MDLFCISILGSSKESVRKLRRTNSTTSAETELIMAAGESRKSNPQEFIEKQRQMLREFEGKNLPDIQDNVVIMSDEESTDFAENFHFKDGHLKNTPQDRSVSLGTKITVQPGLSNGYRNYANFKYQNTTQEYNEYVNIEKEKDFDGNPGKAGRQEAQGKWEQIHEGEMYARSMSYVNVPSGRQMI